MSFRGPARGSAKDPWKHVGGTWGSWHLQTDPLRWSIIRGPVKTVAAIRHVHFEDLGALESVLSGAGNEVRYDEAGIDDLQSPQLARSEPLAVLGGPHSPLRFLERVPVLHWHGDTFDFPEGAELLASTSLYRNQSFRYGKSVLAFQFHPEASTKNFERWLIGHAAEIGSTTGISVTKLRSETARLAPESAPLGQQCLREWLSALDECSQPGKGF